MVEIVKFGVLSMAKISGLFYALLGLLGGVMFTLVSLVGILVGSDEFKLFSIFGLGGIVLFPVMYGLMGFIMGALMAFFYNFAAKWVGGLEVETKK